MIITVEEIQKTLNEVWPDLQQIWCFHERYIFPIREDVERFIYDNKPKIDDIMVSREAFNIEMGTSWGSEEIEINEPECDDFALQLHACINKSVKWPFGQVFSNKNQGWSSLHNLNICTCQDGVIMFDLKKDLSYVASPINDNILWVRI